MSNKTSVELFKEVVEGGYDLSLYLVKMSWEKTCFVKEYTAYSTKNSSISYVKEKSVCYHWMDDIFKADIYNGGGIENFIANYGKNIVSVIKVNYDYMDKLALVEKLIK
jgi:hypothetical protein